MNRTISNHNENISYQKDDSIIGHNSQVKNNSYILDKGNNSKKWPNHHNNQAEEENYEDMYKEILNYLNLES